jgi:hypothetical protein
VLSSGRPRHGGDPADDDGVVAAVVHGVGDALQGGQRAVEQRRAGDRTRAVRHAGQLRHRVQPAGPRTAPGGQPAGGFLRVRGQDRHPPRSGRDDRVMKAGGLLGAEQHQRRLQ